MSSMLPIRLTVLGAIGGLLVAAPAAIAAETVNPWDSQTEVRLAQEWGNEDWERQRVEEREQEWQRENGHSDRDSSDSPDTRDEWFRENRSGRDRRPSTSYPTRPNVIYRDTHPSNRRNTWDNDWNYRDERYDNQSRNNNCYVAFLTQSGVRNSQDAESIAREFIGCEVGINPYSQTIRIRNISQIQDWSDRAWVVQGLLDGDAFSLHINSSNAQIIHYERSPVSYNRTNIWPF